MKRLWIVVVSGILIMSITACQSSGNEPSADIGLEEMKKEKLGGTRVLLGEVTDFYYTYEWIGFNAEYLRYRFYTEDGKYLFYHEARKVKNDYGPATEKDITSSGTVECSEEQWVKFLTYLKEGKAEKPKDTAESGGRGPWMYVYYNQGKETERLEFSFASAESRLGFEGFCETLAR